MPCQQYKRFNFRPGKLTLIETANNIISEYQSQGYDLTLRQLYYQFVARDIIANKDSEYKRLGGIISDARLAGMIDWEAIVDRTRVSRKNQHWQSPGEILGAAASSYMLDSREGQEYYIEVWVEKDALIGVVEQACEGVDVPCLSTRGYASQTALWEAAQRMIAASDNGKNSIIFHLGDHDPSGIDMTRDIQDRINLLTLSLPVEVKRIALNMDQVEEHRPPPNPAKVTDSRFESYVKKYGGESWELDALDPSVLTALIVSEVEAVTVQHKRNAIIEEQEVQREQLAQLAENWEVR